MAARPIWWKQQTPADSVGGQFRERVTLQRKGTKALDEYGNTQEAYSDLGTRYAQVEERTGREQLDAGANSEIGSATIRMHRDSLTSTLKAGDRIYARGRYWLIRSAIQLSFDGRYVEILGEKNVAGT